MFRRLLAAVLILGSAALLLVAAWPQLFGLQQAPLIAHIVSLRAVAAGGALAAIVLLLVITVFSRRFRQFGASLMVLLLAFVLVNAAVLSTRGFTSDPGPGEDAELTVLTWNTLGPATTPDAIAALALDRGADIVVLPETTAETAIEAAGIMRAGGSPMWVHTLAYDQVSPALSTSLLTSVDLGEYTYDRLRETTNVLPTVVATPVSGAGPIIVAVHAVAPIRGQLDRWRDDLAMLADFCSDGSVIMAGDFNATLDHMAGLGTVDGAALGQCGDAAAAGGAAALGTWPTRLPAQLGAPIDHVMATPDWEVTGVQVVEELDDNGSDHRPVVVGLRQSS